MSNYINDADNNKAQVQTVSFSLAFAREFNVTDAVVHYHLQTVTSDRINTVDGGMRRWIPHHTLGWMLWELPCFSNRSTIQSSLKRLADAKRIGVGKSGVLLGYKDGEYTMGGYEYAVIDKQSCYCVLNTMLPRDLIILDAEQVKLHGWMRALILGRLAEDNWNKLSATELAKELPFSRVKIQDDISEMLRRKMIVKHPDKAKLYKIGCNEEGQIAREDIPLTIKMLSFF